MEGALKGNKSPLHVKKEKPPMIESVAVCFGMKRWKNFPWYFSSNSN